MLSYFSSLGTWCKMACIFATYITLVYPDIPSLSLMIACRNIAAVCAVQ